MRSLLIVLLLVSPIVGDDKKDAAREEAARRARMFNDAQATSANAIGAAMKSGAFIKFQKKGQKPAMIVGEPFHELSEDAKNQLTATVYYQLVAARPNFSIPLLIYERKDGKDVKLGSYWVGRQVFVWDKPKEEKRKEDK